MNIWQLLKYRKLNIIGSNKIELFKNITILPGTRLYCHTSYAGKVLDPRLYILDKWVK